MAPLPGMIRYNTDLKYWERSTDEGATWLELDLTGASGGGGGSASQPQILKLVSLRA